MDIAFALNYTNIWMIDITPSASSRTWARLGAGITTVDPNNNEQVEEDEYYDSEGAVDPEVVSIRPVFSFSGDRKYGDPAQDYIASLMYAIGDQRKTSFKRVGPDGTIITGPCTIANIVAFGGDANAKGTLSFELRVKGAPTVTPGNKGTYPSSITASAVSVTVGGTTAVSATVSPAGASDSFVYAVADDTKATVDAAGTVKGIAAGTTDLVIKSAVLPSVTKTVTVTVTGS